jgi:hypothetical protein
VARLEATRTDGGAIARALVTAICDDHGLEGEVAALLCEASNDLGAVAGLVGQVLVELATIGKDAVRLAAEAREEPAEKVLAALLTERTAAEARQAAVMPAVVDSLRRPRPQQ